MAIREAAPMGDEDKLGGSILPQPVRDHLGQQLRAAYEVSNERPKPQYLGDDAETPEVFEPQIRRLETRLKTHEEGTVAVEQVLDKILDAFGVSPLKGEDQYPQDGSEPPGDTPR